MLLAYYGEAGGLSADISALSEYRRERINAMKAPLKKQQGICAELLLYEALKKAAPDIAPPPEISVNEHGKPYLKDGGVFFSLSHSENLSFCAVSELELGADVQQVRPYDRRLMLRFFTAGERKYIESCPDMDCAFTRVWALKESYIKAVGLGLSIPLSSFDLCPKGELMSEIDGHYFWHWQTEGCIFAICVKNGSTEPDIFKKIDL